MAGLRKIFPASIRCYAYQKQLPLRISSSFFYNTRGVNVNSKLSLGEPTSNNSGKITKSDNIPLTVRLATDNIPVTDKTNDSTKNCKSVNCNLINASNITEIKEFLDSAENLTAQEAKFVIFKVRYLCRDLKKNASSLDEIQNLIKSDTFLKVWNKLNELKTHFTCHENYLMVSSFLLLQIPYETNLFKKLIRLFISNINMMKPVDVLSLTDEVSKNNSDNINIAHLKLACLNYLNYCFSQKYEFSDSVPAVLYLAAKPSVPKNIRTTLLSNVYKFITESSPTNDIINFGNALALEYSSRRVDDFLERYAGILRSIPLSSCTEQQLVSILFIYHAMVDLHKAEYNEDYVNEFATIALEKNFSLKSRITLLRAMVSIPHINYNLLMKTIKDSFVTGELSNVDYTYYHKFSIVLILATVDFSQFKDVNWNFYKKKLELIVDDLSYKDNFVVTKVFLAANAAVLNIYNNKLLDLIFRALGEGETKLKNLEKESSEFKLVHWIVLLLNKCVTLMHPSYDGARIPQNVLEQYFKEVIAGMSKYLWSDIMDIVFEGKNYVLKNCTTSLFHVLPFVLVLNNNNEVLDVSQYESKRQNNGYLNLSEIRLKYNERFVIIYEICLRSRLMFKNMDKLTGFGVLNCKTIRAMGFNVVILKCNTFYDMPEVERISYVLNEVEKVCGPIILPSQRRVDSVD